MASRADAMARRSDGRLTIIRSQADLAAHLAARGPNWPVTAGLLAIEGAHALDDDPANVEVVADAGFRMMSPSHFFDNAFGGSAHGIEKGGLTPAGREMVERMEARRMLVDVAHASAATVDDVLAMSTRPVVASHTGARGVLDNARNLSDEHLRGIAASGGLVGVGFWPTACGGDDVAAIVRSIRYAIDVAGVEHVGLGSDFDGGVPRPVRCHGDDPPDRGAARDRPRRRRHRARSWAATRSGCSARRCRRPDAPGPGQTSSAIMAAARAAPSAATGR